MHTILPQLRSEDEKVVSDMALNGCIKKMCPMQVGSADNCNLTNICQCGHCGLMYKPSLGHSCKIMKTYRFKDEDGVHYCDGVSKEDAILLYTGHRISWASHILKNYKITRVYK